MFAMIEPRECHPGIIGQSISPIDEVDKGDVLFAIWRVAIPIVRSPELVSQAPGILLCDRIARRKVHLVVHDEMIR